MTINTHPLLDVRTFTTTFPRPLEFSGVQVTFPLPLYYVTPGSTTTVVPEVNPSSAASSVTFTTSDTDVATVVGSASSLTVIGVKPGSTQLLASISGVQLATTEVDVLKIKFWPREGPILSEAFFEVERPGVSFFSASTAITFDGSFTAGEFASVPLSFTQAAPQVKFNPSRPNRLDMWVGAALPRSFLASPDPAIALGLTGKVKGTSPSPMAATPAAWYLYGQTVRPINDFGTNPPAKIRGNIRSFQPDGTPVSKGVGVDLLLVSSSKKGHVFQTAKPFILVTKPELEGPRSSFNVVAGATRGLPGSALEFTMNRKLRFGWCQGDGRLESSILEVIMP